MKRKIIGYHRDTNNDWVADLACWHGQHVRHNPPFFNRPWVLSQDGRDNMLGVELACVRCDRLEWPDGLVASECSPEFTEENMPQTLQNNHTGWGRIHVLEGMLVYSVQQESFELDPGATGIIVPGMQHSLRATNTVRFYVEFFTRPSGV